MRETLVCLVVETEELDMGLKGLKDKEACHHLFIEHLTEASHDYTNASTAVHHRPRRGGDRGGGKNTHGSWRILSWT